MLPINSSAQSQQLRVGHCVVLSLHRLGQNMALEQAEEALPFLLPIEHPTRRPETDVPPNRDGRFYWLIVLSTSCATALISTLLWILVLSLYSPVLNHLPQNTASSITKTTCGSNYSTAIENQCVFQLWSYSWVPPECFDKELNEQFLALRESEDWHYYSSRFPPVPVPLETVLTGTRNDLWSTWGQHYWHCAFYQRKFFRIIEQHGEGSTEFLKMTNRDLDQHHGIHCQEWLAKPDTYPWDRVMINLTVGYHSCS